ncbi:MAG: family 4 glycosyl hydrolase [Candidatus Asgardarchaeia archaeon]
MKIAIIGGGSTYNPPFVRAIADYKPLEVDEIALMDVDERRNRIVSEFIKRDLRSKGITDIKIKATNDLEEAVEGAYFVVNTIRPGGNRLRGIDERIAIENGLIGEETVGVGGFAFSLRAIPPSVELARTLERVSPDAWLLDVTNPVTAIMEAITRYSNAKAIGVMKESTIVSAWTHEAAKIIGVDPSRIRIVHVGHKHFGWFLKIIVDGKELPVEEVIPKYEEFLSKLSEHDRLDPDFVRDWKWPFPDLPVYFKYYYFTDEALEFQRRKGVTRGEEVVELQKGLLEYYEKCDKLEDIPRKYFMRGSTESERKEAAEHGGFGAFMPGVIELMDAIYNDRQYYTCEAVPHKGAIDGFDEKAVIRVPCIVDRFGYHPIRVGRLPPEIDGILHMLKAHDLLTVEAAMTGSFELALKALITHPLVASYRKAKIVLKKILEAGGPKYYPKFFEEKEEGPYKRNKEYATFI